MSIETLRDDLKANEANFRATTFESVDELKQWMLNNLFPWHGNQCNELDDMDEALADVVGQHEDILQLDTAKIFGTMILGVRELGAELKKRLTTSDADKKLSLAIDNLVAASVEAERTLEEITIPPGDDPDDPDDPDPDDPDTEVANGND